MFHTFTSAVFTTHLQPQPRHRRHIRRCIRCSRSCLPVRPLQRCQPRLQLFSKLLRVCCALLCNASLALCLAGGKLSAFQLSLKLQEGGEAAACRYTGAVDWARLGWVGQGGQAQPRIQIRNNHAKCKAGTTAAASPTPPPGMLALVRRALSRAPMGEPPPLPPAPGPWNPSPRLGAGVCSPAELTDWACRLAAAICRTNRENVFELCFRSCIPVSCVWGGDLGSLTATVG